MVSPLVLLGLGGAALVVVALGSKSSGKARGSERLDKFVMGWPGGLKKRDEMIMLWKRNLGTDADVSRAMWSEANATFTERRKFLPANASGVQDVYTKEKYVLPSGGFPWPSFGSVDEFGRVPGGLPSNFLSTVKQVGLQVAPLIPGVGPAGAAAISYAIAIGQGKSQQDAIIAAARSAVPVQYQLAFDLGVGIASGQSVPDAAKQALFKQVPGSQQYYEQGKSMLKPVKVFPLP